MKLNMRDWLRHSLSSTPILLALLLTWFGGLPWLDYAFYDAQIRLVPPITHAKSNLADDVVIVAIDEASLLHYGRWPWSRDLQAQLIEQLTTAQARAVGYNIILSEKDTENPDADQRLAQAIRLNGRVILPVGFARLENQGQLIEIKPLPMFRAGAAGLGHVLTQPDSDNHIRRCLLYAGLDQTTWPHFSLAVMRLADHHGQRSNAQPNARSDRDENVAPPNPQQAASSLLQSGAQDSLSLDFRLLDKPTPIISAAEVLQGGAAAQLHNKIVLVGVTAAGATTTMRAPALSGRGVHELTGVEFMALAARSLISGSEINTLNLGINVLIALIVMALLGALHSKKYVKITKLLLLHTLALLGVLALSFGLMWLADIWFAPSALIVGIILNFVVISSAQLQRITREAHTDTLTGLANRRRLSTFAETELRRARRNHTRVALLILDIDFFKVYNDHYGHPQGDRALQALGRILQQSTRAETDLAARMGGEEFAVLLTLNDAAGAEAYADRLRNMLAHANIPHEKTDLKRLTVSMGLAICENGTTEFMDLYNAADRSLYAAKRGGRDRLGPIKHIGQTAITPDVKHPE